MADPKDEPSTAAAPTDAPSTPPNSESGSPSVAGGQSTGSAPPSDGAMREPTVVAATGVASGTGAASGAGASIATMTGIAVGTSSTGAKSLSVPTPSEPTAGAAPIPIPIPESLGFRPNVAPLGYPPSYGILNVSDTPLPLKDATPGNVKQSPGPSPSPQATAASGSGAAQGATLTLGPGASVDVGPGASITIGGVLKDATLEATGILTDPPRPPPPPPPPPTETPDEEPEKRRAASVRATVTLDAVIIGAPPDVPEPRSAAISPEWVDGRLTIVAGPARADLPEHELMAAFAAAGAELGRVLAELEASPGNVDRRIIEFARRVADAVPASLPSQFALFGFGQKVDGLKRRVDIAVSEGELSADRAAELQTAVDQLSDCALQFPAWRQFKRNAQAAALTNEQVAGARKLAGELADRLETTEAKEFVDESVPVALRDLAASGFLPDDSPGVVKEGADLPALDLIESSENIHKSVASAAVAAAGGYLRDLREGALKTLTDGNKHGERLVTWALSLLAGAAGAAIYSWSAAVINFLRQISGG